MKAGGIGLPNFSARFREEEECNMRRGEKVRKNKQEARSRTQQVPRRQEVVADKNRRGYD